MSCPFLRTSIRCLPGPRTTTAPDQTLCVGHSADHHSLHHSLYQDFAQRNSAVAAVNYGVYIGKAHLYGLPCGPRLWPGRAGATTGLTVTGAREAGDFKLNAIDCEC